MILRYRNDVLSLFYNFLKNMLWGASADANADADIHNGILAARKHQLISDINLFMSPRSSSLGKDSLYYPAFVIGVKRTYTLGSKRLCFEPPFKLYRWMNVRLTFYFNATSAQRPFLCPP